MPTLTSSRSGRVLKVTAFFASLVVYLFVGYWLQVRHGFIIGDALSRVASAQAVLFSRDHHLAAIGFIFTPLTAMAQIRRSRLARCGRTWPNARSPGRSCRRYSWPVLWCRY